MRRKRLALNGALMITGGVCRLGEDSERLVTLAVKERDQGTISLLDGLWDQGLC